VVPQILATAVVVGLFFAVDGPYLLTQGAWAGHYTFSARPIEDLRDSGALDEQTRSLFDRVSRIRQFATQELGLAESGSYTTYIETERAYLVDVVSAAGELSFERHTWSYPILGDLPYKGFYEREDAVAEAHRIAGEGYDVLVRKVNAYSSLGIVPDPLYSFMSDYSEYRLAELIIHELAHATVFVPGEGSFNEGFASLVGEEGALAYIRSRYGAASQEYLETVRRLRDRQVFLGFVTSLRNRLVRLYESDLPANEKRREKQRIISQNRAALGRYADRWFHTDAYGWFAEAEVDNALIDLYATYNAGIEGGYGEETSPFEAAYRMLGRSIPALVEATREAAGRDDPTGALRAITSAQ
jgi:predicted aminopeptidase